MRRLHRPITERSSHQIRAVLFDQPEQDAVANAVDGLALIALVTEAHPPHLIESPDIAGIDDRSDPRSTLENGLIERGDQLARQSLGIEHDKIEMGVEPCVEVETDDHGKAVVVLPDGAAQPLIGIVEVAMVVVDADALGQERDGVGTERGERHLHPNTLPLSNSTSHPVTANLQLAICAVSRTAPTRPRPETPVQLAHAREPVTQASTSHVALSHAAPSSLTMVISGWFSSGRLS